MPSFNLTYQPLQSNFNIFMRVATNNSGTPVIGVSSLPFNIITRPGPPSFNTIITSTTSVTAFFTAPTQGGTPVLGYYYQLSTNTTGLASPVTYNGNSPLIVNNLIQNQSYILQLSAYTAGGRSAGISRNLDTLFSLLDTNMARVNVNTWAGGTYGAMTIHNNNYYFVPADQTTELSLNNTSNNVTTSAWVSPITDGVNWTVRRILFGGQGWVNIAPPSRPHAYNPRNIFSFNNNIIVTGEYPATWLWMTRTNQILTSNDGVNFTTRYLPGSAWWWGSAGYFSSSNVYVVMGHNVRDLGIDSPLTGTSNLPNRIYYSSDLSTWTAMNYIVLGSNLITRLSGYGFNDTLASIVQGNNITILNANNSSGVSLSSSNGIDWRECPLPGHDGYYNLAWGNNRFVKINAQSKLAWVWTANTGWTSYSCDVGDFVTGIVFNKNLNSFVTIGYYGGNVFGNKTIGISQDGINWAVFRDSIVASKFPQNIVRNLPIEIGAKMFFSTYSGSCCNPVVQGTPPHMLISNI